MEKRISLWCTCQGLEDTLVHSFLLNYLSNCVYLSGMLQRDLGMYVLWTECKCPVRGKNDKDM